MSEEAAELLILRLEAEASAARNASLASLLEIQQSKVLKCEETLKTVTSFLQKTLIDITELISLHPCASTTLTSSSLVSPILRNGPLDEIMEVLSQRIKLLKELQEDV